MTTLERHPDIRTIVALVTLSLTVLGLVYVGATTVANLQQTSTNTTNGLAQMSIVLEQNRRVVEQLSLLEYRVCVLESGTRGTADCRRR